MALTNDDILHIANLARLHLSAEQVERYAKRVSNLLDYIAHLNQLDTSKVDPTSHAVATAPFERDDVIDQTVAAEDLLANAPARDGDLFKVPKVL